MKVKNAIKKIVALGTGAVMLGATVMGAAAADLGDYPRGTFINDGVLSGKVVVGAAAASQDVIGALDIAASLQRAATTTVPVSGTGVSVSDGDTEEVPLGSQVAGSYLDTEYTDSDLSVLQDTSVRINGSNYDFHDEIQLSHSSEWIVPATALSSNQSTYEEDYEDGIYLEVAKHALRYCLVFDESLNLQTELGSASDNDEMEVNFLGTNLRVTTIVDGDSFTVIAGREVFMNAGDSTVVDGKTVTLDRTSSSSAVITVDGVSKVIDQADSYDFDGLNVQVDSVFNDDGIEYDSATLIIGAETEETYNDGDKFLGEPDDDFQWEWDLLDLASTGTNQTLCVQNTKDYEFTSDNDNTLGINEYYSFPNAFAEIGIASVTIGDDDYMGFNAVWDDGIDVSDAITAWSNKAGFILTVDEDEGMLIRYASMSGTGAITADKQSDTVYLIKADNETVSIFYDDSDNNQVFAGNITLTAAASPAWGNINYDKTKTDDLVFYFWGANTNISMSMISSISGDGLAWSLGSSASAFTTLGATADTKEASELNYGGTAASVGGVHIGAKDKDSRTMYGVIVNDPESNGDSNQVDLMIPGDQVKANVVIKSGSAAVGGSGGGSYEAMNAIPVGMGILDSAANLGGSTPYVVVGGPCANTVAAELMGNPANCAEGFMDGEAKVKWFDDQNALLVAGYSAEDTVGASRVVANWEDYDDVFADGNDEFKVIVPTLVDIRVETI